MLREQRNNNAIGILAGLAGFASGAATMYFLDPGRGARRRAGVKDKVTGTASHLPDALRKTAKDVSNRAQGAWAETTNLFSSDDPSDQVLEARVRSKMGRVTSHPHAINVAARNGEVTLSGPILDHEVDRLMQCVGAVRGVSNVVNELQPHKTPNGISSLQGGAPRESRSEFMQQNWSPAARLTAGAAGTAAVTYGLAKRDALGLGLGVAGAALLARSATNIEFQRLLGFGGGRSAVTIDKSINVDAEPGVLYALWSNFENFPQFMSNVLEVRNSGDGVSHWKVVGPAGIPVEWDSVITRDIPGEMIAWKSVEGSTVPNAGYVLFEQNNDGTTEVTVRISYNPPAGAVGHAVAKAFGADPKSEMDADLMRMKAMLETGRTPHDAAQNIYGSPSGGDRSH
ncbi:MAG TPA: SRPBCC family protein [Pyrinomonadaceae bacterium]|nr:SRPBCC family protein [Pyrinomonadaceae bacterium]